VIQGLRDEAHRFGITYHRNRRSKSQIVSELDSIPGVGPATSALLMKHFKSVKRLKECSIEELAEQVGMARSRRIFDYFHPKENQEINQEINQK
jgi:excinuclease ABC subunit C